MLASAEAMIAALRLEIEKLRRALYGARSERKARLLDQLELQLEELEATATEDDLAAEALGAPVAATPARERRRAARKPFPAHLPRERVVVAGADLLRGLRLGADRQARRGCHRDAGGDPAPLEGGPDRAGEVHLPGLRADQPAAGAVPSDAAGLGRPEPAGDDPLREVRPAPAAEPPGRALCPRRRRAQPLDPRRPGRRLRRGARAPARPDRRARARRRAAARRRHPGAGAGEGQDRHRPALGLCARRPSLRRRRPARGALPLLPRPAGRASRGASRRLERHPPGRCLCRLRRALRRRTALPGR